MDVRRILSLAACGLTLAFLPAVAQEPLPNRTQPAQPPATKVTKEQLSYAIGLDAGANLGSTGVEVDLKMVIAGLTDSLSKNKPQMTDQQIVAALQEFQVQVNTIAIARFKAQGEQNKKEGPAFLAENKKKQGITTLPSGLQVQVLKQGTGPQPKKTDRVQVYYSGTFLNGQMFDTSGSQKPLELGVSEVIPGWTEALLRMKVGDKWKLFIPSELAYGEQGSPPLIAGNAVLIFEVELAGIGAAK